MTEAEFEYKLKHDTAFRRACIQDIRHQLPDDGSQCTHLKRVKHQKFLKLQEPFEVFECEVHGECTRNTELPGLKCCLNCADRTTEITRNLIYHVYPVRGSRWRWNAYQLLKRIDQFNGHRIIAIATDRLTESYEEVEKLFSFAGGVHEFIRLNNLPHLREMASLPRMLRRVQTDDPNDYTFFGHAKGVTRTNTPDRWIEILYEANLDYPERIAKLLKRYGVVGGMKKLGKGFPTSASTWHYHGSFYWFRSAMATTRKTRPVDMCWYGAETWPSLMFGAEEAGTIFLEKPMNDLDAYNEKHMKELIEPEFTKWKRA